MHRFRRPTLQAAALGVLLVVVAVALFLGPAGTPPAVAAVTPRTGFRATVLGWSSWYGSYDLGPAGVGWCIDHGLAAPDPAFRYVPVVATDLDPDRRAAMAWIVSSHGGTADPLDAAAVMLALHDLRGAAYPFGVLDVDRLTPAQLAGFAGHEADVVARARAAKAAGLAHRRLRAPFHLAVDVGAAGPSGLVTARVTDAAGLPVDGALVRIEADGARLDDDAWAVAGPDGTLTRRYGLDRPRAGASFRAHASVPDPALAVLAATTARAQRVARPAWLAVEASAAVAAPTTTTTSTSTSTTTTAPATTTTTTRRHPTTTTTATTVPPTTTTTAPPITAAPTTSTTSSAGAAPPPTTGPPPASPGPPATVLPTTGGRTVAWALLGTGLVVLGGALAAGGRRRVV